MAIGDDATEAGLSLVSRTDKAKLTWQWINRLADEVARKLKAITASSVKTSDGSNVQSVLNGKLSRTFSQYQSDFAGRDQQIALVNQRADFLDNNKIGTGGATITGQLYLPNSTPAVNSFTVAYINGDGRIARGASAGRFKKFISAIDPASLGAIFPQLVRYQMRSIDGESGDGTWKLGYIADRLAESPDLERFVVYDGDGQPLSIDFIALLIAQNAQLHQRVTKLEGK